MQSPFFCATFASAIMKYNTHTLSDGLRVIHLPSASPVVYCGYAVNAGTRDERPGEEGMAHFCEHITFKGTSRRRAWHILNALESVGGDLNAFTNKEDTVYHAAVLKEHVARAVDLLTDIVFHSTYPQAEVEKEVGVICDEIESYNDSPAELVYDDFENVLFAGHPLGHNILGREAQLRTYGPEQARAFTRRLYRPANAVFFAYGDVDFDRLVRLLEKAERCPSDGISVESVARDRAQAVLPAYSPGVHVHHMDTHLAHVMTGGRAYDVHDSRRMALYLLNNILGGPGMNARLNVSLRERNALVYTVESTLVSYSDTGLWATYFGCDPKDERRCLRLVRRELDRVMSAPLTDSQLRAAKKQLKGQIGVSCDSRESFALDFARGYLHYGWERDVTSLLSRIEAVTAEEVQQVACETFDPAVMTTYTIR